MNTNTTKLNVFNQVTLDGYFTGVDGDMAWAHTGNDDPEWLDFVKNNASRNDDDILLFGRITYDMMAGYWPTPMAAEQNPVVAEGMNKRRKVVFSTTMQSADWENTTLINDDIVGAVRSMKEQGGQDMTILGSGTIVALLAAAGLIDTYQVVINPHVLGAGRTMFEGVDHPLDMKLVSIRSFKNGKVLLNYERGNNT